MKPGTLFKLVCVPLVVIFEASTGAQEFLPFQPTPSESVDPSEPDVKKKIHRGGSFLSTDQYCARYIAGGRVKGEPEAGTNHVELRLARDVDKQKAARS